jgi:hypothetical protein
MAASMRELIRSIKGPEVSSSPTMLVTSLMSALACFCVKARLIAAAEFFGLGAFQELGGGPPIFEHGPLHRAEGSQIGLHFGPREFAAETVVRFALAADVARRAANVAGSFFDAAAAGNEDAELVEVGFVDGLRAVGEGWRGFGRNGGDHGFAPGTGPVRMCTHVHLVCC